MLTHPDLLARFQALDDFLIAHQALWRPRPFNHLQLPWEADHPQLAGWLRARSLEQADADHSHPERLTAPAPFPELAATAWELGQVADLPSHYTEEPSARLSVDVPGRKWQQIRAFAACLQFTEQPRHWLDWCSGKGHLGRLLAQDGTRLTCLEHDPSLVEAGAALSQRQHLYARHIQQDVLAVDAGQQLTHEHSPVALHACGDLHVRLLELASQSGCSQLAVAPCCYNRITTDHYQALSQAAQASQLKLSRDDLSLPLCETVTAGARARRQRNQSMARRLAFDLLQRQLRDSNDYLPTPSLPGSWLDKPFPQYCLDLAKLKQLPDPGEQDWTSLENAGWKRLAEVRNLELVRNLFRRPLEVWLVLDRALFLEEQGYRVRVGQFCEHRLTPRNLLLLAERRDTHRSCG